MWTSIKNILFSTKLTAFLLLVFAAAIGTATFIENDYGTPASKALIYNTRWFELVIFLLGINLIGNIFRYKMFRKEKLTILTFHISLIVIVIGAAITRYISFEGSMHIREGKSSNVIVSDDAYLRFKVDDKNTQYTAEKKLFLNPLRNKSFTFDFKFNEKPIEVSYKDFIPNSIDTVVKSDEGKNIIELITAGQSGQLSRYIEKGQVKFFGNLPISYNNNEVIEAIQLNETDSGIYFLSPYDIHYLSMDDRREGVLKKDTVHPFQHRKLYSLGKIQLVFKEIHKNVIIKKIPAHKENMNGEDALILDVICNGQEKEVTLFGGKGYLSNPTIFQLEGLNFSMVYGSKEYITPFSVRLNDFKLERYPGSNSPSSYESEVTLLDNRFGGVEFNQRIYMNNVLDYDKYRMFQSSYDQDELGTILSVNHDFWGTLITYIGYALMIIGIVLTLISKKSRFNHLRNKIKALRNTSLLLIFMLSLGLTLNAQHNHQKTIDDIKAQKVEISFSHAENFAHLLVQDQGGRIKPIHTLASEVIRKVTGKQIVDNQTPTQVLLGMMYNPVYWRNVPMIKVKNQQLEKELGATEGKISFVDMFDKKFSYKIANKVEKARRKKPAEQSKYDKELLKVDERTNICFMIYQGVLFRVFPKHNDANNTWFTANEYNRFHSRDSIFVKAFFPMYFSAISTSLEQNDWTIADSVLVHLADFQKKFGANVIPPQSKVDIEITYNKLEIFKKLFMYYGLVGILMLFFLFADIIKSKKWKKVVVKVLTAFLVLLFLTHVGGLIMRWYISGHAPWSNGYESMIYIAFVTILAGFVFSKSSKMTIAATTVLSSLILMVAHLNFMDPEITPLVPVLKSYWLMIHVAVITGSYGFLGLGALLGLICLLLMILRTPRNNDRIGNTLKELTYINEMTITVGLFMAAIGTFLGGVWANESWGRYWGWDPKETWALVIVLFYAMLLHLRFIPKANGKFLFNTLALFGFSTVIMTYLGVNYYLSGLHSYAKGDPVPIPTFVPITIAIALVITIIAYFRNKSFSSVRS